MGGNTYDCKIVASNITCRDTIFVTYTFVFNYETRRFIFSKISPLGYVIGGSKDFKTDVLYAGKCEKF